MFDENRFQEVLSTVGNDGMTLLLSMLIAELSEAPLKIGNLVYCGAVLSARKEAHSLKGAAEAVGAFDLAGSALVLEQQLSNERDAIPSFRTLAAVAIQTRREAEDRLIALRSH
ncbi:Hpt domain-containing protein [Sphingomonas sp.]|uniref:Hpt domain-containing protein n=1 Tax=Sphingomonas sp. TaxID=28214 RepID=UPI002E15D367|nr:Hpt domain-containing protein [Sphingomonas sp.]